MQSTGCGTWEKVDGYVGRGGLCSGIHSYNTDNPGWGWFACHCYSGAHSNSISGCPLGWGLDYNYDHYEPGCQNGSHYPHPIAAYDGLSPYLGSSH